MNSQPIGKSGLLSSRLSYGCMRIAGTWVVSEIDAERRARARDAVLAAFEAGYTLIVNQVEIHLGRLDCFYDGTLDQCLAENITPLSWSPLAGGWLGAGGTVREKHPRRQHLLKIQQHVDEMARQYGVSRSVLALAWLLKPASGIIPIVGSANPANIRDAVRADELEITREDWYRLLVTARGEPLP